jgi:hypothetical protein
MKRPTQSVRRVEGITTNKKCDIELVGVCISSPNGPVQPVEVGKDYRMHVCSKCFDQQIRLKRWVEQPPEEQ